MIFRDAIVQGYNVINGKYTEAKNVTEFTDAWGRVTFGNVSQFVLKPTATSYRIPISFQELTDLSNVLEPTNMYYIDGIDFSDSDFIYDSPVTIKESKNTLFSVSEPYPNPSSDMTRITLSLKSISSVSYEVINKLGQVIQTANYDKLSVGNHDIDINLKNMSAGIYFYTVTSGDFMESGKIIVE